MSDLRTFLVRLAMDDAFRAAFLADADATFAGHTLSDDEKAALRARDSRMLDLYATAQTGAAPQPASSEAPPAPPIALPEVWFGLRIAPTATYTPEGVRIDFGVTLHPIAPPVAPPPPENPWGHRVDSESAREAAAAVLAAPPAERFQRLLALAATLTR